MSSLKRAVVFPGQGSQYVGMLESYFNQEEKLKKFFEKASKILDLDLIHLVKEGSKEELSKTEITQPLMLVSDLAIWHLISNKFSEAHCVAGHSLGEYAALVASKALNFEDALKIVQKRAALMKKFTPKDKGGIAAIIGLNENKVSEICSKISLDKEKIVNTANINSPNQIVISGTKKGIDQAIEMSKLSGAKRAIPLNMNAPAHSELMRPASIEFKKILENFNMKDPIIPVIQNVDAIKSTSKEEIKRKLVEQLYSPVRWTDTIDTISKLGVSLIVECGPSKVLSGLIKRINTSLKTIELDDYNNYLELIND